MQYLLSSSPSPNWTLQPLPHGPPEEFLPDHQDFFPPHSLIDVLKQDMVLVYEISIKNEYPRFMSPIVELSDFWLFYFRNKSKLFFLFVILMLCNMLMNKNYFILHSISNFK